MPAEKKHLSKKAKIAVSVLLILAIVAISLASTILIIADKQDRSSTSLFYESILSAVLSTKTDEQGSYKDIEKSRKKNEDYKTPKIYSTLYNFDIATFQDTEVCVFNKGSKSTVLYLHGGAFIYQPLIFHYDFCKRLAKELDVTIFMPVYPKAPNYTYDTIISYCADYYLSLLEFSAAEDIVFMGDSAGATLIMCLSQYLYDNEIPQPKEIFAFSPCIDLSLTNDDIPAYQSLDPMLNIRDIQIKLAAYVGEGSYENPYINPYYCDFAMLPTMTVFVGGHEIFLPDCKKLNEELSEVGIDLNYYEFPYMNHTFSIFPMPESKECMMIIKDIWGI